ncbi:MAG: glycosyl hydrolase family 18 protein [Chloroflexi bacterium]|nr:glycosyl hydrolase family 18 protein [Chloroflexota bacterium]
MKRTPSNPLLGALSSFFEGRSAGRLAYLLVLPVLLLFALVLPPISLPQRLFGGGGPSYTTVYAGKAGSVSDADGNKFSIPAGASKDSVSIKLTALSQDEFAKSAAAQTLPPALAVKSRFYQPSLQGSMPARALLSVAIPYGIDSLGALDVYGVTGKKWSKLPFQLYRDQQRIDVNLTGAIPDGVLVVQTRPQAPVISADLSTSAPLPASANGVLAEVSPVGLTIADNGGIAGSISSQAAAGASSPYQVLPTISDLVGGQLRSDLVDIMITNSNLRQQHIQALVDLTVEKLYPGVNIDYQGATPDNKNDFTGFIQDLAKALHAKDKVLSVTLAAPVPKSAETWDTGPYDWDAIARAADIVRIPLPLNNNAYTGNPSPVETYLQWAVGRMDRYKIDLSFSMLSRDEFSNSYSPINLTDALKIIGPVSISDNIQPGGQATFDLPKMRDAGFKYDPVTGLYSFAYSDSQGQAHTVWLESADSLAKKLAIAAQFNLRGVALRDFGDSLEARAWDVLKQYRQAQTPAFQSAPAIVWRVNGQAVGKAPVSDPKFVWTVPDQIGDTQVEAYLSFDDGQGLAGSAGSTVVQVAQNTTPSKAGTGSTSKPTATKASNSGNSTAPAATKTVRPPAPQPTPKPPPAPASNFVGQNLFNYGAQLNWTNADNSSEMGTLNQMGFKWAKIQVRWCDISGSKTQADLSQIGRLLDTANAHGIKVMLSIVCAPKWSRADGGAGGSGPPDNMQDAADFMGGVASFFCGNPALGAIEVWNEHNLLTEWHGKPISAALYMDMLKRSYTSIKQKCPRVIVVSGAPTPTGVTNSTAMDDVAFLTQLYQNGLKDYSDAIGAHPSGFGNAPDVPPGTPNATGQFQGHRSFYFRGTMEAYRAVMVQFGDRNKQIWPTEFGWGVDPSPKPGYEYEKFITESQQAAWLVKAYQLMKSWGYVGVGFVWNLDFTDMSNETGAFHILGRPAFGALAGMAK